MYQRRFSLFSLFALLVILSALVASPIAVPRSVAQQATPCPTVEASSQTIKVGAVVPLTGRYASGGEQIKNGYELAVEDINGAGGVQIACQSYKLELTLLDDESDPTKTVQRMETLYSSNEVLAYLGGFGSDLHAAAAAIAEKNKTPYIGVAFALYQIHQKGFKYLFSPFPKSPSLAVATFDLLDTLEPKLTKVAIFAEKTDWGAELRGLWKKEADARGYQIVAEEEYAPASKDFSSMILKAKSAEAQVVLSLPNPPDGLAIAKQMKELDFTPGFALVIRAADGATWGQNLGKDGDGFLLMPGWNPEAKFDGVKEMNERHMKKYEKSAQATTGPAYAAVQILAEAISSAGKLDRDAIRDALAKGEFETTVIGPVTFNEDGTGKVVTIINQYQNGKQVLVWPPDQAVGKFELFKAWKDR